LEGNRKADKRKKETKIVLYHTEAVAEFLRAKITVLICGGHFA
jgi:hypothetical protein